MRSKQLQRYVMIQILKSTRVCPASVLSHTNEPHNQPKRGHVIIGRILFT